MQLEDFRIPTLKARRDSFSPIGVLTGAFHLRNGREVIDEKTYEPIGFTVDVAATIAASVLRKVPDWLSYRDGWAMLVLVPLFSQDNSPPGYLDEIDFVVEVQWDGMPIFNRLRQRRRLISYGDLCTTDSVWCFAQKVISTTESIPMTRRFN